MGVLNGVPPQTKWPIRPHGRTVRPPFPHPQNKKGAGKREYPTTVRRAPEETRFLLMTIALLTCLAPCKQRWGNRPPRSNRYEDLRCLSGRGIPQHAIRCYSERKNPWRSLAASQSAQFRNQISRLLLRAHKPRRNFLAVL
jgi:hypothetical protein